MQPTTTAQITQNGHLPGKTTAMSVNASDMPHIMNILTRQYSDPIMAVLREYSANARDSHIMAGKSDVPIEVTLPNRFNSNLVIKDYGVGMSVDFVENRYSKYGDSDKRHSDDFIGGFGIGGKAALAYTDSFTLTSVHDGVKGAFVISRDASGAGSIKTVAIVKTDEPNSVEIKVPAVNVDDFDSKAEWLFKFWPEGSVLVNGEPPRRHNGQPVTDKIWYSKNEDGQSYLVMGGVPYRIANVRNYFPLSSHISKFHFIAEIGIEEAAITPSREDLEYNDLTKATIKRVIGEFEKGFTDMVKREILSQATAPKAFDSWLSWRQNIGDVLDGMTYNGERLPREVPMSGFRWNRNAHRYGTSTRPTTSITVTEARNSLFVTGREGIASTYTKSRVGLWIKGQEFPRPSNIYFVDQLPKSPFIGTMNVVKWEDILKVKGSTRNAGSGTFKVMKMNAYGWSEIDATGDQLRAESSALLLVTPAEWKGYGSKHAIAKALTVLGADVTLVKLPQARWNAFRKKYRAESLHDWATSFIKLEVASVPATVWQMKSLGSTSRYILKKVNKEKVKDPEVKALVDKVLAKSNSDAEERANFAIGLASYLKISIDKKSKDTDYLIDQYPLIDAMYYANIKYDELYIYMNAAYEIRKGQ